MGKMKVIDKLKAKLNRNKYKVDIERFNLENNEEYSAKVLRIMNLLNYTKKSGTSYSGGQFNSGYHSFTIDGHEFKGQRNPGQRLEGVPFDFTNSSVIDFGCNQGGMLFEIADKIKYGVGIDYDSKMINAANKMKSSGGTNNLDFFVFDLERENLDYIKDFIQEDKVDVVFLLSICMWIQNWKEVITFISKISSNLVFESNGSEQQQRDQINYLKSTFDKVQLIREKSDDDPSQKNRQLYFCSI